MPAVARASIAALPALALASRRRARRRAARPPVQPLRAPLGPRPHLPRSKGATGLAENGKVVHLAAAMHAPKNRVRGTLVRARLCRRADGLVYVLTVLAHDGKVARATVDAVKGTVVGERLSGGNSLRLLVVEDDPDLNRQLATALTDAGYVVDRAFDGEEGHYLGETEPYDAVILDIGLPKMDGISVLEAWRRAGRAMPVLILTARDRWSDKVQGFDAGADDYVAKPFHLEEVLARVRALLRRSAGHAKSELTCGPVRLDTRTGRVTVDGNPVKLTSHEYRLLAYLMHHTGRVVSRTELVEHLYDQDFDRDSNTIEVFVGRIRKKLGVDVIQTVRGLGYLLTPPDAR